jgi:hypothetical protein
LNEPKTAICQFRNGHGSERYRLQLFRHKCAQGATALKDEQRSEVKEAGLSLNGNPRE